MTDGAHRHHTKQASINISVTLYVKRVKGIMARNKILFINQSMRCDKSSDIDLGLLKIEKEQYVKLLKGMKNALYTLPESFTKYLNEELKDSDAFDRNDYLQNPKEKYWYNM